MSPLSSPPLHTGPECDHGCPEFPGLNRGDFNAVVDLQDSYQSYLPMFKAAVRPPSEGGGGSSSIMSSFSHVNGVDMAANKHLLQDVLRDAFGFGDGLVVTDWGSISGFERSPQCSNQTCVMQRAQQCLDAGTDMDLRGGYQVLADAVSAGIVGVELIEKSLRRILAVAFKLGRYDPPESVPWRSIPASAIGSPAHRALAKEAATKSMVLVQNGADGRHSLPTDVTRVSGIAVTGPSSNATGDDAIMAYCGDYAACERCGDGHAVSVATGIAQYLQSAKSPAKLLLSAGCTDGRNGSDTSGIAEAVAHAQRAEVSHVVVAVGLDGSLEGEGNDRLPSRFPNGIGLPGMQQDLVNAVVAVGKQTTVVVIGGGAMPITAAGPLVSVIYAPYPGVETGNALAELLFGAASPSGRLPFTVPASAQQLPLYTNFSMVAEPHGRTFGWIAGEGAQPMHEYGFGLSYTRFKYSTLQLGARSFDAKAPSDIAVQVTVTNIGAAVSDEVLQVYAAWQPDDAFEGRVPVRQLVGFRRLAAVSAGSSRVWKGSIPAEQYALVDRNGRSVVPTGTLTLSVGGHQPTEYSHSASGSDCVSKAITFRA